MKKVLSSILMMCCIAVGVAQAQDFSGIQVNALNNNSFANTQTMLRNGEWLSYAPDGVTPGGMIGIGMAFYWGYMFPASSLTPYAGGQITQVGYVDPGDPQFAGTYELYIWTGDSQPETEVAHQTYQVTGMSGDIEILQLGTPVAIDGHQNIWICQYQDGSVQYPAAFMTDPGEPNARWIGVDGYGFMDMATVQGGEGMAWILWAYADGFDAIGEFDSNVAVYPNPTQGSVNVMAPGMSHVSVLNALGQVVYDANVSTKSVTLDLGQYEAGIYMVRVEGENGVSVRRISVVK